MKGATFNVVNKKKFQFPCIKVGKVVTAVRDRSSGKIYLRFYDYNKYGEEIPSDDKSMLHCEAKYMLSNDANINGIRWTRRSTSLATENTFKRKKCKHVGWKYVDANGNEIESSPSDADGMLDEEDNKDSESSSVSEGSEEDETDETDDDDDNMILLSPLSYSETELTTRYVHSVHYIYVFCL